MRVSASSVRRFAAPQTFSHRRMNSVNRAIFTTLIAVSDPARARAVCARAWARFARNKRNASRFANLWRTLQRISGARAERARAILRKDRTISSCVPRYGTAAPLLQFIQSRGIAYRYYFSVLVVLLPARRRRR